MWLDDLRSKNDSERRQGFSNLCDALGAVCQRAADKGGAEYSCGSYSVGQTSSAPSTRYTKDFVLKLVCWRHGTRTQTPWGDFHASLNLQGFFGGQERSFSVSWQGVGASGKDALQGNAAVLDALPVLRRELAGFLHAFLRPASLNDLSPELRQGLTAYLAQMEKQTGERE